MQKSSLDSGTPVVTFFSGLFPQILGIVAEGFACPANNFDRNPNLGTIYGKFMIFQILQPAIQYSFIEF